MVQVEQGMSESDYRPNSAQQLLAQEVTRFVHGQPGLDEALRATQVHFRQSDECLTVIIIILNIMTIFTARTWLLQLHRSGLQAEAQACSRLTKPVTEFVP